MKKVLVIFSLVLVLFSLTVPVFAIDFDIDPGLQILTSDSVSSVRAAASYNFTSPRYFTYIGNGRFYGYIGSNPNNTFTFSKNDGSYYFGNTTITITSLESTGFLWYQNGHLVGSIKSHDLPYTFNIVAQNYVLVDSGYNLSFITNPFDSISVTFNFLNTNYSFSGSFFPVVSNNTFTISSSSDLSINFNDSNLLLGSADVSTSNNVTLKYWNFPQLLTFYSSLFHSFDYIGDLFSLPYLNLSILVISILSICFVIFVIVFMVKKFTGGSHV